MSGLLLEAVPDITAHITNQLTFQVRRATIVAREIIRVVRRATIVALPRRSLFISISRGLRKQLKAVLQELVAAAFLLLCHLL